MKLQGIIFFVYYFPNLGSRRNTITATFSGPNFMTSEMIYPSPGSGGMSYQVGGSVVGLNGNRYRIQTSSKRPNSLLLVSYDVNLMPDELVDYGNFTPVSNRTLNDVCKHSRIKGAFKLFNFRLIKKFGISIIQKMFFLKRNNNVPVQIYCHFKLNIKGKRRNHYRSCFYIVHFIISPF